MANKPLCEVDTINSVTANDKIFVNVNGTIKQSKMSDIPAIIQLGNAQGNLTHGCMNAGVYKVLGTEDGHPVPGQAGVMTVLNDGNNGKYKSLALVNGQTYTMNQDEAGTVLVNWRCVEKDLDELNNSLVEKTSWKLAGNGTTDLSSIWDDINEINVRVFKPQSDNLYNSINVTIPKSQIPSTSDNATFYNHNGAYYGGTNGYGIRIDMYKATISLGAFFVNGVSQTGATMNVYYR